MATSFGRNQILSKYSEEDHGRNISVKFHQNIMYFQRRCLKKKLTHGQTDARTNARRTTGHGISSLAYGWRCL